jgi:hypothetical protein
MAIGALLIGGGLIMAHSHQDPGSSRQEPAQASIPPRTGEHRDDEVASVAVIPPSPPINTPVQEIGTAAKNDLTSTPLHVGEPVSSVARQPLKQAVKVQRARRSDLASTHDHPAAIRTKIPLSREAAQIEPYRNGTMAKHLTGEALRLALIEDRRLTREMNEATLRDIREKEASQ